MVFPPHFWGTTGSYVIATVNYHSIQLMPRRQSNSIAFASCCGGLSETALPDFAIPYAHFCRRLTTLRARGVCVTPHRRIKWRWTFH